MKSFFAGLFIALLLTGCASLNEKKKERALEQATIFYERAIRWGDFATAARFQRMDDAAKQPAALPTNVSVTSYQQVNSRALADGNEVNITVRIDYYNNDSCDFTGCRYAGTGMCGYCTKGKEHMM